MIDNKKSLKEHLTTGVTVITENGTVYKVIQYPEQTYLVREGGYLCLSQYNDNLEILGDIHSFDIQKIYSTSSPACFMGDKIDGSLIWERKKNMTMKETRSLYSKKYNRPNGIQLTSQIIKNKNSQFAGFTNNINTLNKNKKL